MLSLLSAVGMDTTLTVESVDGAPFQNLTDIVVGGASDVIVAVRCVATPAGPVEWSYGGNSSVVTSGLTPFGVSQEDGVLRVYPASLLGEEDQYTCNNRDSAQMHTVSVRFRLSKNNKICNFSYRINKILCDDVNFKVLIHLSLEHPIVNCRLFIYFVERISFVYLLLM